MVTGMFRNTLACTATPLVQASGSFFKIQQGWILLVVRSSYHQDMVNNFRSPDNIETD